MIISKLPVNGVFIDLGANIGAITIPVCKNRGDITAIALEASPQMVKYLNENVNMNSIDNCSIENVAIWDKHDHTISFFVPQEQYGKGMISVHSSEHNIQRVKTTTLDQLCIKYNVNKVDLIKVDIEGFEYFAFKGGEKLLKENNAPDILFEFIATAEKGALNLEPGDAQSLLLKYGYKLFVMNNNQFIPLLKPMNDHYAMIFATKNRYELNT
jgi:FkbM family methyltransferase